MYHTNIARDKSGEDENMFFSDIDFSFYKEPENDNYKTGVYSRSIRDGTAQAQSIRENVTKSMKLNSGPLYNSRNEKRAESRRDEMLISQREEQYSFRNKEHIGLGEQAYVIMRNEEFVRSRKEQLFSSKRNSETRPSTSDDISTVSNESFGMDGSMARSKKPEYFLYTGPDGPLCPSKDYPDDGSTTTPDNFENYPGTRQSDRYENKNTYSEEELVKRRKDSMTGCHQFLRYATTLFTFVVFLAGAGILGLGIYILGSDYGAKQVSEILGNDLYQIAAYVLIASGAALIFVSMCGCCGALRESKCMLGCFVFFISIFVIALVAAAAMVFVFREKMEGDIIHSMKDVLTDKYGVDLHNSENRMITDMWNWVQRELKCCGVNGNATSLTSWSLYRHSEWYKGFGSGKPYVPQSCCDPNGDLNVCTGIAPLNGTQNAGPPIANTATRNPNLYTTGCYDELVHYIQSHSVIIGVCSIATVIVMLFGLLFSVYLCRKIDIEYYSY